MKIDILSFWPIILENIRICEISPMFPMQERAENELEISQMTNMRILHLSTKIESFEYSIMNFPNSPDSIP
jgi:hypothetical protein